MRIALAVALLLAGLPAAAVPADPSPPVWQAGSHYTASLEREAGRWLLHGADGHDLSVQVPASCGAAPRIPQGVWLLVHRGPGLALAAPSGVALPPGHAGEVALSDCSGSADALRLPGPLLDLLAEHSGAVHVAD